MVFNSIPFLVFLPIVFVVYYILPSKWRWAWLLAASCYFYMWFVPVYLLILATTIVIDYFAGIYIEKSVGKRRKLALIFSLIANIGILCVFKYYNFFVENIYEALSGFGLNLTPLPHLGILLPIGLSFHTFQAMSYTLEIYKGNQAPILHFGKYALYVMFFPQLVAGPIEKPQAIFPQFHFNFKLEWSNVVIGLRWILWGLFKKVAIADQLNPMVAYVYDNPTNFNGLPIYMATIIFVFQVYCDFSGYSDMALGLAKLFGINLIENFKNPLLAKTFTHFWARWHVSLMNWFRDYLMFPMVKKGRPWQFVFIFVFLLSGFWHGANWTFVLWGIYNGVAVIYTKSTQKWREKFLDKLGFSRKNWFRSLVQSLSVFHLFALGGILFRAESIIDVITMYKNLVIGFGDSLQQVWFNQNNARETLLYLGSVPLVFYIQVCLVILLLTIESKMKSENINCYFESMRKIPRYVFYTFLVFAVILLSGSQQIDFVYFQF
jgi:D-alanyl-lipoteichoic acid acyltransferase DltB (MBOAT superfamily)